MRESEGELWQEAAHYSQSATSRRHYHKLNIAANINLIVRHLRFARKQIECRMQLATATATAAGNCRHCLAGSTVSVRAVDR